METVFRRYLPTDLPRCLHLFRGNVPDFFTSSEERDYRAFLEELPGPYFVLESLGGDLLACGGIASDGALCWGMVDRTRHRSGLGKLLLLRRLEAMLRAYGPRTVRLTTSQHSAGFFARFGFRSTEIQVDGLAPGLDRVEMELHLDAAAAARLGLGG